MSDLDILVPVYNEAETVQELSKRIESTLKKSGLDYNVFFVDDNSTDNTVEEIKKYAVQNGHVNGELQKRDGELKSSSTRLIKSEDTGETYEHLGTIVYDSSIQNGEDKTNGEMSPNRLGNKEHKNGESKIKILQKKGSRGKAYSILEAARVSDAPYLAMIDGDLQYPPEVIPDMYQLAKDYGVVVANRKSHETSLFRKIGTKINAFLFGKVLHDLDCDTQSGLKVFKKEVINKVKTDDVTPWTLDLPLLVKAKELGYKIGTVDIEFKERTAGESKVDYLKATLEIVFSAIRLRFKKAKVHLLGPTDDNSTVGAGIAYKGKRFVTHSHIETDISALETFTTWQKIFIFVLFWVVLTSLLAYPIPTGIVLVSALSILYFADLLFSLRVLLKSLHFPPEIEVSEEEIDKLKDDGLPVYTILCPLYKEANVLPHFVESINDIDWPKEKLDVQLLLEEDDQETIQKAEELNLPEHFRIMVVPHSEPKTKPKACNYGLAQAKGEYSVIYDAEDRPDPLQLKKSYIAFTRLDSKIVCLQSKLNYYNTDQNLLTRLFTAEYSLWFDLILPGLQSIDTTIPLGGTSNHFKTSALKYLGGWDPFNVTEDCDLGARLFKAGLKTAIVNSTTYEEANSKLSSWLKQRSRWIKGYLQTYLVHMRNPIDFYRKHGRHALIFQLVIGMRMVFMIINPLMWTLTISYFALRSVVGPAIEALYPSVIFYIAVFSLVFGNFIYLYNYMIGCAKRRQWSLMKYVFFVPLYWFMASVAAAKAFKQLIIKPYYWEKTTHGLHLSGGKGFLPSIEFGLSINSSNGALARPLSFIKKSYSLLFKNIRDFVDLIGPLPEPESIEDGKARILVFNWRDIKHVWSGGAEVYIHELAKRWVKEGHSVTVFCGWDAKAKREEEIDGVNTVRRGGFYTVYVFAALYYLLRFRKNYDIVVDSQNGIPFFTPAFVGLPKILLTLHVHQEIFKKYLKFPLSTVAKFLESKVVPFLYKYTKVVTISSSSKKDLVDLGWFNGTNIEIATPGIEPRKFKKYEKTQHPSFVYLGRLKPYKKVDTAINAFSQIKKNYKDAQLTIAGFGETHTELKRLSGRLGLTDSIVFAGRVSEKEKARLFAKSWAAIQPSLMEGWGITVIEANAAGTPVIASDSKGLVDSVVDGETGILFPAGNPDKLAEAMARLIEDKNLRERMSKNAYKWSKNFSWDKASKKFEFVLYQELQKEGIIPAYDLVKGGYEL